jgi:dTMP kinase
MEEFPGKYIVLEGHDGAGKSTQISRVATHLASRGLEALIIEEPGSEDPSQGIPVANELRGIIKNGDLKKDGHTNLLLFTAARHELWEQRIAPALKLGHYVLSARNWLSSIAYQGYGEGLDLDLIEQTTRNFTDPRYVEPDLTLILAFENELERLARIENRGKIQEAPDTFESRGDDFQSRVQQGYAKIVERYGYSTINAEQSAEVITEQIVTHLPSAQQTS